MTLILIFYQNYFSLSNFFSMVCFYNKLGFGQVLMNANFVFSVSKVIVCIV